VLAIAAVLRRDSKGGLTLRESTSFIPAKKTTATIVRNESYALISTHKSAADIVNA
jgi:hypothetical protein